MKKLFLLLLCFFGHAFADGLPDLGDSSQTVLSPAEERQIGRQSMLQIRARKQYLNDAEINDYLGQLGAGLVEHSSESGQDFEFFAVDDYSINAFAMPGGLVGVNAGLLLTAQSESELASVLSHEISHITQHHIARMLAGQQNDTLTSMAAIAIAILAARTNPQAAEAAIVSVQAGAIQKQLNYTRSFEQEADRIGLQLLQKSGYNARSMPEFLLRLQKATRLQDSNAPSYARTHPITSERIAEIENRVQTQPYRLIPDSLNFQLVRAKLIAAQKTAPDAIAYFDAALGEKNFGNPIAQRYGLVAALLRDNQIERAAQELATLRNQLQESQASNNKVSGKPGLAKKTLNTLNTQNALNIQNAPKGQTPGFNPMIATLTGQVMRAEKNDAATLAFYAAASKTFPQHRALIYDYVELLLQDQQAETAVKLLTEQLVRHPSDATLYDLQARAYAAQGKVLEQYQARAYSYAWQGNLYAALEQLELAKRAGGSFYQLSTIESDLRELRELLDDHKKK